MKPRKFSAEFKARVAMDAIKLQKTIAEISSIYQVHTSQIVRWKTQAISGLKDIFSNKNTKSQINYEARIENLYTQIGKLQVENEYLKKTVYQS